MLWETVFDPQTRNLVPLNDISPDDVDIASALEVLYGKDTEARKRIILDRLNSGGYDSYVDFLKNQSREENEILPYVEDEFEYYDV